jgi:hypothetical protein
MERTTFDLLIEGIPYMVMVEPFTFNTEPRFTVKFNDSPEYIFSWDDELLKFSSMGDASSTIPDELEEAIATRLYTMSTSQKS